MINGTKLLNVAGMTRGRRDGILKSEKVRHVVKIGPMHLKGVWYVPISAIKPAGELFFFDIATGFLSRGLWILPTKKRSRSCCTPCSCTTLVHYFTIRPTRTEQPRSCRLLNAVSRNSRRKCGARSHRPHCLPSSSTITTITQWRFLDHSHLYHPTAVLLLTVPTRSPHLPQVRPA